jgi:hypothetical protein
MSGISRRAVVLGTLMMASVVSCTLVFAHFHHLDRAAGQPSLSHSGGAKWGAHYSTVAVAVISAIHHDKGEVHIVNTRNNGALPDLPPECVVELPSPCGPYASGDTGADPSRQGL